MYISALFLILAMLFNSFASTLFKLSADQKNQYSVLFMVIGLLLGGINAVFYTKSLNRIPLSIAYPVFSAGSIILITLVSMFFFREKLNIKQMLGMVTIMAGIVLVSMK
jgi:multidrug transporter EmrE-like cation transporter